MRIGTDVSIAEGYTVIDFKVEELFPNGRKQPLDKDAPVRVTIYFPPSWNDGRPLSLYDTFEGHPPLLYITDNEYCWNDVYEIYLAKKESIALRDLGI